MAITAEVVQEVLDILNDAGFVVVSEDWWLTSIAAHSELERIAKYCDNSEEALEALIEVMLLWEGTAAETLPEEIELFVEDV
jgi:hypothetical protein